MNRFQGDYVVPKRLPLDSKTLNLAQEVIDVFKGCVQLERSELDDRLHILEGAETDYRVKRGFAHILRNGFSEFESISPIDPQVLRQLVFEASSKFVPSKASTLSVLTKVAERLSHDTEKEITIEAVEKGLYADLNERHILLSFDAPSAEDLVHRYNLSQAQGILYRATNIIITAYRNDPGEYKQLFKYLKLFRLMTYIEGDADHGFSITIDGPASLFGSSTRYGTDIAKFLPSLLHVTKWKMEAQLAPRKQFDGTTKEGRFSIDSDCGLVSHYKRGKVFDSAVEESFYNSWGKLKTDWGLEREVELIPIPGSVMIPDFRLVHPEHAPYLFEIVGYWRPEYLKKKFWQVKKAQRDDLILAISERLNLGEAGIKIEDVPAKVIWFKGKVQARDVLQAIAV